MERSSHVGVAKKVAETRQEYDTAVQGAASLIQTTRDLRNRARDTRERARELRTCAESRRIAILMMTWDPETLGPQGVEIEASGFVVMYTREPSMFLELLGTHDFACAVIGDSIPSYLRLELLRDSKQAKPDVPIVVIEGREADIAELRPYAAKIVAPSEPLSHLLRAIRSVTRKSKLQAGAEPAIPVSETDRKDRH